MCVPPTPTHDSVRSVQADSVLGVRALATPPWGVAQSAPLSVRAMATPPLGRGQSAPLSVRD